MFMEAVKYARIKEIFLLRRNARNHEVCLDHRMILRVENKCNHVAYVCHDAGRFELNRIITGPDFDCMRGGRSGCQRRRGKFCYCYCIARIHEWCYQQIKNVQHVGLNRGILVSSEYYRKSDVWFFFSRNQPKKEKKRERERERQRIKGLTEKKRQKKKISTKRTNKRIISIESY